MLRGGTSALARGGLLATVIGLALLVAALVNEHAGYHAAPETLALNGAPLRELLLELPLHTPHHVCITGSHAEKTARDLLLPSEVPLAPFDMPSRLNPENECRALEAVVGHTLVTVAEQIEDRCAARWKVHASTCDVLVHAEEGADCEQLFKFRAIADQPHAPLVVLAAGWTHEAGDATDAPLLQCYETRVRSAAQRRLVPLEAEAMAPRISLPLHGGERTGAALRAAMLDILAQAAAGPHAYPPSHGWPADARALRSHLLKGAEASAIVTDVQIEMLKASQGIPHCLSHLAAPRAAAAANGSTNEPHRRALQSDADTPIVIAAFSGMIQAGFAGDDAPRRTFPAVVGRARGAGPDSQTLVGDEVAPLVSQLMLTYPITRGFVTNWEDMKKLYRYTFYNQLCTAPEEHNVLLSEPPLNPKDQQAKMVATVLGECNAPGVYVLTDAMLALYASQQTTGLVIESDEGVTHVVPVYEGYVLSHAVQRLEMGGNEIYMRMVGLFVGLGLYELSANSARGTVEDILKTLAYVSLDSGEEPSEPMSSECLAQAERAGYVSTRSSSPSTEIKQKNYELPGGKVITLGAELFKAPEALFQPDLIGLDQHGIHELAMEAIMKCDADVRPDLLQSVVLAGTNMMFDQLSERLKKEMDKLAPAGMSVNIVRARAPMTRARPRSALQLRLT